jgi:hypothetical protein
MRKQVLAALIGAAIAGGAFAATGPSSSQSPYVTPTAPDWSVTSVLTVGDAADNGYRMVGIPDGLGAYDNGNGTFTVLMNHELGATDGVVRAHGATGAFVSEWVINKSDFKVLSGSDLIQSTKVWYAAGNQYVNATTSFQRFCSADLPLRSAFYDASSGMGTTERIFMNGEESGVNGRAFGIVATGAAKGTAYELPHLGNFSWENSVANPYSGNKTIVVGTDDSTPGQVYLYKGDKQATGTDIQKAGLVGGKLYGVAVTNGGANYGGSAVVRENAGALNGTFTLVQKFNNGDASGRSGADLQADSVLKGVTEFARPEDGAWSLDGRSFYFVTTGASVDGNTQSARLYRLDFDAQFNAGELTMVLDAATLTGTDGATARSFDNMTVSANGEVIIQEDPGGNAYIAKTWKFDPTTGKATQILESDRERFLAGGLTIDEESSGVIEITDVLGKQDGKRYFLGDMQAHYGLADPELVQGGQVYITAVPVPEPKTYALMLGGLGVIGFVARRRRPR